MTLGIFQSEEKDKYTHENSENKQTIANQKKSKNNHNINKMKGMNRYFSIITRILMISIPQ